MNMNHCVMNRIACALMLALACSTAMYGRDFDEREVVVVADDGVARGATLIVPDASTKPKAAIVLATGSGVQNRDEEIMGKKPFKTLAEYLSAAGYVVLRADDRGFANASDAVGATIDTDAADVAAAVALIDSIYPSLPVGIIGHSSGGTSAVRNATGHNKAVDFIVTLAGPAWSGDSIIMSQSRAIAMAAMGRWDAESLQRKLLSLAKSELPDASARISLTMAFNEHLGDAANLPNVQESLQKQISALLSPWYRSMLRYDPAVDIASVGMPWLAINGSKDSQVLPGNLDTIKALNPSADVVLMDGHNHLFQKCQTGSVQEYSTLPGDISAETLKVISDWLDKAVAR